MSTNMTAAPCGNIALRFPGWPTKPNRPNPPLVRLEFRGLSLISYNRQLKRCEIGFLDDEDGKHPLNITIKENGGQPQPARPSSVMTVGLDTTPEVYFFKDGTAQ